MRLNRTIKIVYSALFLVSLLLTACGGGGGGTTTVIDETSSYTVGGTISGLVGSAVLQDNSGDNLTVSANGSFTFATNVASGGAYNVTVLTQPSGQTCTVGSGNGTISGNVTNIAVVCSNNSYTMSGSVTGLTGSLVLQDNGGDNLTVSAVGTFTFATSITNGNTYSVTVLTQPTGQTCSVSTGAGTVSGNNVTNVAVVCSTNTYSVGGTVSGLVGTMVLQDNNGDNLTFAANGTFTFVTQVANGSPYSVTVFTHPVGQSCSVVAGTGSIALANVTNVTVTCAASTYTIGGTVTGLSGSMVLQNNGGDNLTVAVNGPFTFATTVAYGNPFNVTVLTQPSGQTCTISSGSGTIGTANVTNVLVNCGTTSFAYVTDYASNNVSSYAVNAATGALTSIGSPIAAGTGPDFITLSPNGAYAYVTNYNSANVSAYAINASTGALTQIAGSPFAAGSFPNSVTISPNGAFAYVTIGNKVSAYTINASTGALTPVTGSPFTTGAAPTSVTVSPNGAYAYVANSGGTSGGISAYAVNASTGALTQIAGSPFAAGTSPISVTVSPNGAYVYVANNGSADVSAYAVNANTGALTPIGSPIAAGTNPISVTVSPNGAYVYVANNGSADVSAYAVNASTGALTAVAGSPFPAGTNPSSITVSPNGTYVYVSNVNGTNVSAYAINASTGALTAVTGSPFPAGSGPMSIAIW
jgi:6-phosphogluconolactonase (cycloisomerase 2 family)